MSAVRTRIYVANRTWLGAMHAAYMVARVLLNGDASTRRKEGRTDHDSQGRFPHFEAWSRDGDRY
jgi:hypothetical protein